jgi:hypothetical protein
MSIAFLFASNSTFVNVKGQFEDNNEFMGGVPTYLLIVKGIAL